MSNENLRSLIDASQLPELYPTHMHDAEFWQQLGRTIATYGFLEDILGRAIVALTATKPCNTVKELDTANHNWLPTLELALIDPLGKLADSYRKAANEHTELSTMNIDELVENIKEASKIRNVLCHGSWGTPNSNGASIPRFVNRQKEIFETPIDIQWLEQTQGYVAELSCHVINSVTYMGWQFPGECGLGNPIFNRDS